MDDGRPEAFSFAAAGWLKMYYFGVSLALIEAQLHRHADFAGASAGSLVAAATILDLDFVMIRDFALECVRRCHGSYTKAFQCHKFVEEIFDSTLLTHENAVEKLEKRLSVSVTTLPWVKNKMYTSFESPEKLKQILLASCCMTPIAGVPFKLDGKWVCDGGLSELQPLVPGKKNITVSVFYFSKADIKPSMYLPVWWAVYPPRVEDFEWVFDLGYNDAQDWMDKNPQLCRSQPSYRRDINHKWPYHHSGQERSFARFFGYRSVLKVIPSTFFDILLLFLVFAIIEPCAYFLIYAELILHAWMNLAKAILCSAPLVGLQHVAQQSKDRFALCVKKMFDHRLALKMIPGLGKLVDWDSEDMHDMSAVFRFTNHFL